MGTFRVWKYWKHSSNTNFFQNKLGQERPPPNFERYPTPLNEKIYIYIYRYSFFLFHCKVEDLTIIILDQVIPKASKRQDPGILFPGQFGWKIWAFQLERHKQTNFLPNSEENCTKSINIDSNWS